MRHRTQGRRSALFVAGLAVGAIPGVVTAQDQVADGTPAILSETAPQATPLTLPGGDRSDAPAIGTGSLALPRGDVIGFRNDSVLPSAKRTVNGVTVAARSRPEFDPSGIQLGSFTLFPALTARGGYDSNVYVQQDGVSDAYGILRADVALKSNWGRNSLSFDGYVNERAYSKFVTESGITYRGRVRSRYDIAEDSAISADVQHERAFVRRGGTGDLILTRQPVRYTLTSGQLSGTKEFGHLTTQLTGFAGRYNYEDAERPTGEPVDQQYRDYSLYRGSAELGYRTGAGPIFFLSATGDIRRFRLPRGPILRDADGIEVLGGVSSEITPLLRGRLGLGYIYADFKDPNIESRGALGFQADLDYLVTELTTVKFSAQRYFQNVAAAVSPAALATEFDIGVDHELLRNVILSTSLSYRQSKFVILDTTSKGYGIEGGVRWLVSKHLRADASASYRNRKGNGEILGIPAARTFNQLQATFGFTITP